MKPESFKFADANTDEQLLRCSVNSSNSIQHYIFNFFRALFVGIEKIKIIVASYSQISLLGDFFFGNDLVRKFLFLFNEQQEAVATMTGKVSYYFYAATLLGLA